MGSNNLMDRHQISPLILLVPITHEEKKVKSNFYFHTSLWCLKGFPKTFWGTTKKCENKNLP